MELVYEPSGSGRCGRHPRQLVESAALAPEARFRYFMESLQTCHHVWGLCRGRHWLLIHDGASRLALPLWPTWEHAEDWNAHQYSCWHKEYAPRQIGKQTLMFDLLPLLVADNLPLELFCVPGSRGMVMPADALSDWLVTSDAIVLDQAKCWQGVR